MFDKFVLGLVLIAGGLMISGLNMRKVIGSGVLATEEREVSGFDRIVLNGSGNVIVTQGDEESLTVEAEDNLLPYIKTEVDGTTLRLSPRPLGMLFFWPTKSITYRITVKSLEGMSINGSGSFTAETLETDSLDARISGSGRISVEKLEADRVSVAISGSGTTILSGQAETQALSISGSGRLLHGSLESDSVKVSIAGSGRAEVWAEDNLKVTVSGSGTVIYAGSPEVDQRVSGVASIKRK